MQKNHPNFFRTQLFLHSTPASNNLPKHGTSHSIKDLSHMRKPTICVSDQVGHKPACTSTQDSRKLKNYGFRKKRNCTIPVAKTKALISFAVTVKLICAFVFTYANCWFSDAMAHLKSICQINFWNRKKPLLYIMHSCAVNFIAR